jgi:hypothetical protein
MMRIKFLIFLSILCIQSCKTQTNKIKGVSFVASREAVNEAHITPLVNVNANYAAVMPFGFMRNLDNPKVIFDTERQWFGETKDGAEQYINELRKQQIKIMLKPQIWVWHGEFTGFIKMENEVDWRAFEVAYTKFILEYAHLAQDLNVAMFCIGTELEKFIENRPNYWSNLISEIRAIYQGKLTYAANWDEFKRTPFWNQLDFIGVDAYFPVSESKTPSFDDCMKGWKKHKEIIKSLSMKYNKRILFTEYGYRSVDYSGKAPWVSDVRMNQVNLEAQINTTKALFETFWKEDWFAGGFVWKWFHNYDEVGGKNDFMYTPQNKPSEKIIKCYYKLGNE